MNVELYRVMKPVLEYAMRRKVQLSGGSNLVTVGILTLCLCVLGPTGMIAQTGTKSRLADVKSAKCVFRLYATGTWDSGEPRAEVKPATLSVAFDAIDTDEGTARSIGPFGPTHIIAKLSMVSLHLLFIGTEGSLHLTTIFDRETREGKLKAVHTRHEYTDVSLPGYTSRPEQYYGECEIKN